MRFVTLILLGMSAVAMSCPDFTGTYSCPETEDVPASTLIVSQELVDGVVTYSMAEEVDGEKQEATFVTDGVSRDLGEQDEEFQATYTASCSEDVLNVAVVMTKPFDADYTVAMTTEGGFKSEVTYEGEIVSSSVCTKN